MFTAMKRILLIAMLSALGCRNPITFVPPDASPLQPLPTFTYLWARMESCSGITADMNRIHWFTTPTTMTTPDGASHLAVWVSPHTIYLWQADAMDSTSWVVPHEMLHDLIQRGDHPPVFQGCRV